MNPEMFWLTLFVSFGNENIMINPDLTSCVGDAAKTALMPHTDGVLLVTELQTLTLL